MKFFRTNKVLPTKENFVWYKPNVYVAFGDFGDGQLAVKVTDSDIGFELNIYDQDSNFIIKIDENNLHKLRDFFRDDEDISKAMNGQHPSLVIDFKGSGGWQLDYIDKEGSICLIEYIGPNSLSESLEVIENLPEDELAVILNRSLKVYRKV